MNNTEQIDIKISRSKLFILIALCCAFIALGVYFITLETPEEITYWNDPFKLAVAGYLTLAFFGFGLVMLIAKLFGEDIGLTITHSGLKDNSNYTAVGEIPWSDIIAFEIFEIQKQKLILVIVRNPEHYIEMQKGKLKKKIMRMNYNSYGTPLSISSNTLRISFKELLGLLNEHHNKWRLAHLKNQ